MIMINKKKQKKITKLKIAQFSNDNDQNKGDANIYTKIKKTI